MWRVTLLGRVEISDGAGMEVKLRARKEYELLAILAERAGQGVMRTELAELLWPGSDRDSGRASLRNALSGLRRVLGSEAVSCGVEEIRLGVGVLVCDAFEGKVGAEYPGDFMPGFSSDWVLDQRFKTREEWVEGRICAAREMWGVGEREAAVAALDSACVVDELHEGAAELRVGYLKEVGEHVKSVRALDRHRGRVWQALGLDSSVTDGKQGLECPLLMMGEWLMERDPERAMEYLASTVDFWSARDIGTGLALHNRVLESCPESGKGRAEVLATKLHLEWAAGKLGKGYMLAESCMAEALGCGDSKLALRYGVVGMYGRLSVGDFKGALRTARAVKEGVAGLEDKRFQGVVDINVGIIFQHSGRLGESRGLVYGGGEKLIECGSAEEAAGASQVMAHYYVEEGRLNLASEALARSQRYFRNSGGVRGEGWSDCAEAEMLYGLGELRRALPILQRLLDQGTDVLGHSLIGMAGDLVGRIYSELGEYDAAAESLIGAALGRKSLGVKSSLYERKGLAPAWVSIQERLSRSDLARAYDRARSSSTGTSRVRSV